MSDPTSHDASELRELNAGYVRAFLESDAAWYERRLADDFRCIRFDGHMIGRDEFIRRAREPAHVIRFELDEVTVQVDGALAIVQARTRYQREDGSAACNRYTDLWVLRDGRWRAVTAQITPVLAP